MSERNKGQEKGFEGDDSWQCCRVKIPPDQVAFLTSVLEGYDNQFLVRTEDRRNGIACIWYAVPSRLLLEEVLLDLGRDMPVKVLSYSKGMDGLDQVFPE